MQASALLAIVLVTASAQPPAAAPRRATQTGCLGEIGARQAGGLLDQCRRVAAGPEICQANLSCDALRMRIKLGCEAARGDAPTFCEFYVDRDMDEDE